jgi:hypothetical protein
MRQEIQEVRCTSEPIIAIATADLTSNDLRSGSARRRLPRRERSMFPKVRHSIGDGLDEEKQNDDHRRTFESGVANDGSKPAKHYGPAQQR